MLMQKRRRQSYACFGVLAHFRFGQKLLSKVKLPTSTDRPKADASRSM